MTASLDRCEHSGATRPARVHRFTASRRHAPWCEDPRIGDLMLSEGWPTIWYARLADGWRHMASRAVRDGILRLPAPDIDWVVVDLLATDLFTDALAHYGDAVREQDDWRPSADHQAQRVLLEVRPSDAGLRRAFDVRESDWKLIDQWHSVRLAWHAEQWHIERADFGNGLVFLARQATSFMVPPLFVSGVQVTRELATLVECYRASLAPPRCAFLLFRKTCRAVHSPSDLCAYVVRKLGPLRWQLLAHAPTASSGRGRALHVMGPRDTDFAQICAALDAEDVEALDMALLSVVTDAGSKSPDDPYQTLLRVAPNWSTQAEWSHTDCQWPAVHQFLLDRALAFAPLALPAYVLLWLLEWLPEMRHHVHIQAIRLLEAVRTSMQRVYTARGAK